MALVLVQENGIAQLKSPTRSGSALLVQESGVARLKSQTSSSAAWIVEESGIVRLQVRGASIAIHAIGSNILGGVNTISVTVPAGGVPSGTVIGVAVSDTSNVSGGISDTAGNGYNRIDQQTPDNSATAVLAYSASGNALAPGNTITYTLGQAGHNAAITAFYFTGANISLGAGAVEFLASNAGTGTTPNQVSNTPVQSGEFLVSAVAAASVVASFTQDTIDAAWATPPGQVSIAGPTLVGGSVINPSLAPYTYAPLLGTSVPWAALMMGVRPA